MSESGGHRDKCESVRTAVTVQGNKSLVIPETALLLLQMRDYPESHFFLLVAKEETK
jgi:hypothetical protein